MGGVCQTSLAAGLANPLAGAAFLTMGVIMKRIALLLLVCLVAPCHGQYKSVPKWRADHLIREAVEKRVAVVRAEWAWQRRFVSLPVDAAPGRSPERLKKLPGFEDWRKRAHERIVSGK